MEIRLTEGEVSRFISSIKPFKALSPQDLRRIVASARAVGFVRGDTIYSEGEPADCAWVLFKGRAQVFALNSQGRSFALESLAPGEIFGTLCRLGTKSSTYPCTAVASEETVALRIPEGVFLEFYMSSAGFARGLCALCSERLQDVQGLRSLGQEAVPTRIAAMLARLARSHGPTIPFTKRELSELVGATLETTFRALAALERKGILSSSRGKIHLKKPEALEALACRS